MPSPRAIAPVALIVALASLTSCKEEDTRLFDETGVWSVVKYSLDGTPFDDVPANRKNAFLLRFKPEDGVVAAAACHEENENPDIESATCSNASLATWTCRCFAYTYDTNVMVWQEFPPGDTPPPVGMPGDGETDGAGDGAVEIELSVFGELASTYQFAPLPETLFSSDGDLSKYAFQLKADTVWTDVDNNNDDVPDLEACSIGCFPSEN